MLLIIFSNLTQTTKFKKLATQHGIRGVKILQTPRELSDQGCSYAVKAPFEVYNDLLSLMKEASIYPVSVFRAENLTKGKIFYTKIK